MSGSINALGFKVTTPSIVTEFGSKFVDFGFLFYISGAITAAIYKLKLQKYLIALAKSLSEDSRNNNANWALNPPRVSFNVNEDDPDKTINEITPLLRYYETKFSNKPQLIYPLKLVIAKANFCKKDYDLAFEMSYEGLNYFKNIEKKSELDIIYIRSNLDFIASIFRAKENYEMMAKTFYEGFKFSEGNLKAYCAYKVGQIYFHLLLKPEKAEKYYRQAYLILNKIKDIPENLLIFLRSLHSYALCLKKRNAKDEAFAIFKQISQEYHPINDVRQKVDYAQNKEAAEFVESYVNETDKDTEDNQDIVKFYKEIAEL